MGKCLCVELPEMDYTEALVIQRTIIAAKIDNTIDADILLLLEHSPVFTLGRRGGRENLTVPDAFLEKKGISVVHVERGGNITFHGPGQIVGYPIIDLRAGRLKVVAYVEKLEEVMIRTARDYEVKAGRNPMNRGAWVGNNKIGSIGIAVRHSVSFHGFALNVDIPLEPFTWMNPCGLHGIGVTSMAQESPKTLSTPVVRKTLKSHFSDILGMDLISTPLSTLNIDCRCTDATGIV